MWHHVFWKGYKTLLPQGINQLLIKPRKKLPMGFLFHHCEVSTEAQQQVYWTNMTTGTTQYGNSSIVSE